MEHRSGGAVAGLDENGQRTLASRRRCLSGGQLATEIIATGLISRQGIEFVHQREEVGRSLRTQSLRLGGPFRGSLEGPTLPHACNEAFEQALTQGWVSLLSGQTQETFATSSVGR